MLLPCTLAIAVFAAPTPPSSLPEPPPAVDRPEVSPGQRVRVHLDDGSVVVGRLFSMDSRQLTVRTFDGSVSELDWTRVQAIDRSRDSPAGPVVGALAGVALGTALVFAIVPKTEFCPFSECEPDSFVRTLAALAIGTVDLPLGAFLGRRFFRHWQPAARPSDLALAIVPTRGAVQARLAVRF
jgi:hypothetical protein